MVNEAADMDGPVGHPLGSALVFPKHRGIGPALARSNIHGTFYVRKEILRVSRISNFRRFGFA